MKWKLNWWPKTRTSNPISKLVRPILESKRIRSAIGGIFAFGGVVTANAMYAPVEGYNLIPQSPDQIILETVMTATPLPSMTGVSQGFSFFHPGVDLTAPLGSPIFALKEGTVLQVETLKTGYGRHVIIEHKDGLTSLYAHMGKINVEEGDVVNGETQIGEVGLTGHTTGPHLHMEIRVNGVPVNPVGYLH